MKDKRGLSTIVVTLIIVLLAIVATGIIWVVVRGIIDVGVGQVNINAKCVDIEVKATKLVSTDTTTYDVTLQREASRDEISGVKLIFTNATGDTNFIYDASGNIALLKIKKVSSGDTGISNVNKVEVVVYFKDESGEEQLCSKTSSYNF